MKNKSNVTFVIVSWNNEDLLPECLESIKAQTHSSYTTILVDNGSSDNSVAVSQKTLPEIKVIKTGKNLGFTGGNNVGIKTALADPDIEYVALLNTDARLEKDWLKTVVEFVTTKPRWACAQGTTLNYSDTGVIDSTHLYFTRGGQGAQGHWQESYYEELGPKKVFGVNAAACLISRKFIDAQPYRQLFDESFFMYLEDVDIAARATIMGWDNYLVPGARAYHMGSISSGGKSGFSDYGLYMTFRNNLAVILKNYPWSLVLKLILALPLTDYRTARHLNKLGYKSAARKVIAGRIVGIGRSPIYLIKRLRMRGKRKIDKDYLWQLMDRGY